MILDDTIVLLLQYSQIMPTKIRVGIPLPNGQLMAAARDANCPVLFSANAFMLRAKDGDWIKRVRTLATSEYGSLDAALDSAGFVAAARYRGYPWTIDQYLDLAQAYDWSFYSSMDLCVENEVAGSKIEVMFRVAETCRLYGEICRYAGNRGMKMPMPVLQGWTIEQYLWCVDNIGIVDWPNLVGIGSMCRRDVGGDHGILAVVDALDHVLPKNVQFHLFGVKGKALESLGSHPRIHSVDSMAWDFAARRAHPVGRTMKVRLDFMFEWLRRNSAIAAGKQRHHTPTMLRHEPECVSEELASWLDLVVSNEIEGGHARIYAAREFVFE